MMDDFDKAGRTLSASLRATLMDEDDPVLTRSLCRARLRGQEARRRVYTGQKKVGGSWVQCGKMPRPGKRTCHWHRGLEDSATDEEGCSD